ncbi:MAG TPA: putative Ig domain-containing protein, partial [Vicinamibacterales bacterium]|nr:putative Ig domain-containing protein [Vicinamibacterales bacterium]
MRKRSFSPIRSGVEGLERRALLAAAVVQSPPPPVVQFDISSVANADVIITKPAGGAVDTDQTSVDRNISGGDWSMFTQSAASALKPASDPVATGLPDNGFFPANAFHPDVQLSFNNQTDGNNVRRADVDGLVAPVSQFAFTLNVPQNNYTDLHVFLTSGHGQSVFNLKLNYSDGSSTTSTATTVPDWFFPVSNSSSQYNLITGMDREKANLTGYQDANAATIFGFHFAVDSSKVLQSFSVTPMTVQGSIVFFGATGVVANHPPVLSPIPDQNINEQNTLAVTASATDPDGNAITYSLDAAPSGAAINPSTGVITWTPNETQGPGNYGITVRATDNGSPPLSDVKSFNVTISDIAPTLTSPGEQTVNELTPLAFTLSASDPDLSAEQLTYSIVNGALPGMSLDAQTGAFSWTPSELQDGVGNVTFRVTDEDGASDSKTITIHVNEVNQAPVLTVTNPPVVVKTTSLSFPVASATESDQANDGITFTYSLAQAGGPATAIGVAIDPATGVLTWTPSADQAAGAYTFNVSVDDNTHSADSVVTKPITVTVSSVGIVNGDLLVVGTSSNDNISVTPGAGAQIGVAVNSENYTVDGTAITGKIKVLGFQGTDAVQVSGAISQTFDVEESGSSDTLIVTATDANDTIALANQTITVDGNLISFTNEANLIVDALGGDDSVSMTGQAGAFSTTINGGTGSNTFSADLTGDFSSILQLLDIQAANIKVAGNFSGTLTAEENVAAPGSGVISSLTVGGSITTGGYVDAGAISNVSVALNMDGTLIADGAGTITDLSIGGSLGGSVTAVEDSNAGSGTISNTSIGSVGSTGTLSGGTLTGVTVSSDMAGTIKAQGAGTITGVSIGGTLTGSVTAPEDVSNGTPVAGTGVISGTSVGSVG